MTNQHRTIVLTGVLVLALGWTTGPAYGQGSGPPAAPEIQPCGLAPQLEPAAQIGGMIDPHSFAPTVIVEREVHIGGHMDPYGVALTAVIDQRSNYGGFVDPYGFAATAWLDQRVQVGGYINPFGYAPTVVADPGE